MYVGAGARTACGTYIHTGNNEPGWQQGHGKGARPRGGRHSTRHRNSKSMQSSEGLRPIVFLAPSVGGVCETTNLAQRRLAPGKALAKCHVANKRQRQSEPPYLARGTNVLVAWRGALTFLAHMEMWALVRVPDASCSRSRSRIAS